MCVCVCVCAHFCVLCCVCVSESVCVCVCRGLLFLVGTCPWKSPSGSFPNSSAHLSWLVLLCPGILKGQRHVPLGKKMSTRRNLAESPI